MQSDEGIKNVCQAEQILSLLRWQQLCQRFGINDRAAIEREFRCIVAAYAESHRAYHTAQHIGECFTLLDWAAGQSSLTTQQHLALEMALWYHDVVYRPQAYDNEWRSAQQATAFLRTYAAVSGQKLQVKALIMATCHGDRWDRQIGLADWMMDIDLAILGASPQRFWQYHHQIRQEYGWLPTRVYRTKREEVLTGFLARSSIYRTDLFRARFEAQARDNLLAVISASKFSSP
ncbi:n-methyl-d-aspartate receptor nmdar2c subunit [Leptolyngbya sp. Heron Island J]|uniref:HD domain-containing protein n=1 Tax=Leptolyngbya sp. Heron Island J TaxID=1385935 RepID=UPI0003B9880E|nr:n-methyl-d-aspartate receptor nmdar2c subunit [Leptolyngbya sp. Heron Island J]ESA32653.1 n-methyl-d-aspartate receptor nmdar2c subunit [Leptolyngbya sp. Heron Island J]